MFLRRKLQPLYFVMCNFWETKAFSVKNENFAEHILVKCAPPPQRLKKHFFDGQSDILTSVVEGRLQY
jgi:hypothetical protein